MKRLRPGVGGSGNLIARPGAGALAVVWLISLFAFVRGFLMLGLGFRLKGLKGDVDSAVGAAA